MPSAHAQCHYSIEHAHKREQIWCVCIMPVCLPSAQVTVHTSLYILSVCTCDSTQMPSGTKVLIMIEWLDRQIELLQTVMFNCIQAEYTRIRHALWKLTHVSMLCISLETSSSPVQQTQPGKCMACCVIGCFPALFTTFRVVQKQLAYQEGLPRYIRSQLVKTTSKLSGSASSSQASPALKVMLPM